MRSLKWGLFAALPIAACVGDSTVEPDAGKDATTTDVANDVAPQDGGEDADAAPPPCNLSAPFGGKTSLSTGASGVNVPGDLQTSFYPRADELYALLSRSVPDSGLGFDIYSVSRPTKAALYGSTTRVDVLDSDAGNDDLNPVISNDATEIFFARAIGPNVGNVWTAVMSDAGFSQPSKANGSINNSLNRAEPSWLTQDGTHLYINGILLDAGAQLDIYFATRTGPGQTFTALKIASVLNSTSNDKNAVLTQDQLTVFFASDRPNGQGGYDIYTATRADTTSAFNAPTPVAELDTAQDEWPTWVDPYGCRIVVSDGTTVFQYSRP